MLRNVQRGSTWPSERRGAKLLHFDGVAIGVTVGVAVGVTVGVAVGVAVGVTVGVAVGVTHCPALATVLPLRIGRGLALLAEQQR